MGVLVSMIPFFSLPAHAISHRTLFTATGANFFDDLGRSVSTAGDVNGDGYADVIVGAPDNDDGGSDAGRAYVYFGGPAGDAVADLTMTGEASNNNFGYSVGAAGDVNADGFDDWIVGAYRNGGSMGMVFLT
jgi:energy-converting hydrogenase Eha subunit B